MWNNSHHIPFAYRFWYHISYCMPPLPQEKILKIWWYHMSICLTQAHCEQGNCVLYEWGIVPNYIYLKYPSGCQQSKTSHYLPPLRLCHPTLALRSPPHMVWCVFLCGWGPGKSWKLYIILSHFVLKMKNFIPLCFPFISPSYHQQIILHNPIRCCI